MKIKGVSVVPLIVLVVVTLGCNLGKVAVTTPGQSTATAIQGGITAREGYARAEVKALAWNPHAVLVSVDPQIETMKTSPVDLKGASKAWVYSFVDSTLTDLTEREKKGFWVVVNKDGVTSSQASPVQVAGDLQAALSDWKLDSPDAFLVCDQNGGEAYRAVFPDVQISADLSLTAAAPQAGTSPATENNVSWTVTYRNADGTNRTCSIDGASGKLYRLYTANDTRQAPRNGLFPIAAKAAAQTALSQALVWNVGAVLIQVKAEMMPAAIWTPKDGLTYFWTMTYKIQPAATPAEAQRALVVTVSSEGLESFQEMPDSYVYQSFAAPEDWKVDSPAAVKTAEASGGSAFRTQNPQAEMGLVLTLAYQTTDTPQGTKSMQWDISYNAANAHQDYVIDPSDGHLIATQ